MKITIPVTKDVEFDLSDEQTDNILLDILYQDYHATWKFMASDDLLDAIRAVFKLYADEDIDNQLERVH